MLEFLRKRLAELLEQRKTAATARDAVLATPQAETRDLTAAERTAFDEHRGAVLKLDDELADVTKRIADAEADAERERRAGEMHVQAGLTGRATGGAVVTSEPTAYGQGRRHSYFLDLARDQLGRGDGDGGVQSARDRLRRHAAELVVELPAREARRSAAAERALDGIADLRPEQRASVFERSAGPTEQRVNPNRVDGQGGYFVPPLWLVDEYINLPRFGRNALNLCHNMPLPGGTDSINLPKVSTGTKTDVQAADGGAVTSQDMTDTFINAPVRTIAGQEDVAMQLLDQSPISFDEIIYADLQADYNARFDIQALIGTGLNGQHLGILNVSGINAVTYTSGSPTLPGMYPGFAQGASQVYKNRKLPATAALIYPSVWYWATAQVDTTNRPLIVPPQFAFNPAGTQSDLADGTGPVGMLSMGLPAYLDGNLPTNLGAGTNESRVIEARWSDIYAWEGALQTRVLSEVLSGTLQIRFQVYAYSAFMAGRRPEAISVLSGTGFVPQSGY